MFHRWQKFCNADPGADPGGGGEPGGGEPGGQPGGEPGGQPGGEPGGQPGGAASWRDSLPDDLRNDPAIAGFGSLADLAKEHVNVQGLIGRKGVIPPKENDPPEVAERFYNELGRPEKPEGYDFKEFKPPEGLPWSDELVGNMTPSFHKHGLTQTQAAGLLQDYAEMQQAEFQALTGKLATQREASDAELKKTWGDDKFKENWALAERGLQASAGKDLERLSEMRLLDGTLVFEDPGVIQVLHKLTTAALAGGLAEDGGGLDGLGSLSGDAAQTAQQQIETYRREINAEAGKHPYDDPRHPEHKAAQAKMARLYNLANPEPER